CCRPSQPARGSSRNWPAGRTPTSPRRPPRPRPRPTDPRGPAPRFGPAGARDRLVEDLRHVEVVELDVHRLGLVAAPLHLQADPAVPQRLVGVGRVDDLLAVHPEAQPDLLAVVLALAGDLEPVRPVLGEAGDGVLGDELLGALLPVHLAEDGPLAVVADDEQVVALVVTVVAAAAEQPVPRVGGPLGDGG